MKVRGKRALLNGPGYQTTAAIVAEIEDTRGQPKREEWRTPYVTLQVSNCDRSISFEIDAFESDGQAGLTNDLLKIDTMIESLTTFRAALISEKRMFDQRKRKAKR